MGSVVQFGRGFGRALGRVAGLPDARDLLHYDYTRGQYYVRNRGYIPFDSAHDFSRATARTRQLPSSLEEIAVNEPARDWDAASSQYMLSMQGQRTNLYTYSSDFSSDWNTINLRINPSTVPKPLGTGYASQIELDAISGFHFFNQDNPLTAGQWYTHSMFVYAGTSNYVQIASSTGFIVGYQNFDLTDGSLGNGDIVAQGGLVNIESIGGGWFRIWAAMEAQSTTVGRFVALPIASPTDLRVPSLFDEGLSVIVFGAQFEAGDSPTAYIPTTGSTETRSPDLCDIDLAALGIDLSDGYTVVVEGILDGVEGGYDTFFQLDDGDNGNRQNVFCNRDSGYLGTRVYSGGVSSGVVGNYSYNLGDTVKFAIRLKQDDLSASVNGGGVSVDTSVGFVTPNILRFAGYVSGGVPASARYASLRILPPQTDATLEALSAL